MVDFGDRIKYLRAQNGLTQAQLAERIGVTKSMVSAYETSMRLPSFDTLIKIAYEFKVTTDYLLGVIGEDMKSMPKLSEKERQAIFKLIEVFREN